jgi:alanyl-tRNA synthetase
MLTKQRLMSTNQLRSEFLKYFQDHGHEVVASSSLILDDPTLLFVNAGMVPFKDVFLGKEKRSYARATSSQRCVRAGGKHNDLERVGYTARHHTFFEMLGNFSFGDYFKREAIQFAWQFLTVNLGLSPEKLWVTVFREDDEAADIWLNEIKVSPQRFSRCDEDDNFWTMGATGPCGPCTEIFYDHGPDIAGGPPGSPDADGDRYIEIWNLVFMQYDRASDGTLTPLPKPSVDTGMGLERIAAVMQHVNNNYDIDLFQHLVKAIAKISKTTDLTNTSLRVIADHIRSCAFLVADGVTPSNEGRGYVLRRIIRRALRHGNKLGLTEPFFYQLVEPLANEMGEAYPELVKQKKHIEKTLRQEEEQFNLTLTQGLKLFEQVVSELKGSKTIAGEDLFKLYDTYGFPVDLTADIARELDLDVDLAGFDKAMEQQRDRSRQASKFTADYSTGVGITTPTQFTGDKNFLNDPTPDTGKVIALYQDGKAVDEVKAGDASVILDRTPFYAEAGGQIGDQGNLFSDQMMFRVADTIKQGQAHVHIGKLEKGSLKVGDSVQAQVDAVRRAATVLNHTATHLLHHALRELLGSHVTQKGSLVEPERLRFEFAHGAPMTPAEIQTVEQRVNEEIRRNHEAVVKVTTPEKAVASGAMALFGEKYGDAVRVVSFGNSKELCGGTHAHHTGDIGIFKIISESGVAAGVRRIEAVTGGGALNWLDKRDQDNRQTLRDAEERIRGLEKSLEQVKTKLAGSLSQDLVAQAKDINGVKIVSAALDNIDPKSLRTTIDQLKDKLGSAVIALGVVTDGRVNLAAGVTKDQIGKIKAGELVSMLAQQVGGKGGGRPDLAEAGGNQPENLASALASVEAYAREKLAK